MTFTGKNMELAEKLYEKLKEKVGEGTAMSISIVKDNEVIASAAAGTRDGDPAHPAQTGDLFNIGSCSKVFVTTAIMKLVEAGKITLDTPVCTILPRFTMKDERYKKITVRHLLNHSSGLPGSQYYLWFNSKDVDKQLMIDNFYEYLSETGLKADPGEYMVYCNDGFNMAQLVVEELSGMDFTHYVYETVLAPLGCVSIGAGSFNPDNRVLIQPKGKSKEYITVVGCGGLAGAMDDIARFCWNFVEPGEIINKTMVEQMGARQITTRVIEGIEPGFGLGWDMVDLKSAKVDLGDDTCVKSGGTLQFNTYMIASKKLGLSGAISQTTDCKADVLNLLIECMAEAAGAEIKEPENLEKKDLPEEIAKEYAGRYYGHTGRVDISFEDGCLMVKKDDKPLLPPIPWTGEAFTSGPVKVGFKTDERGIKYLTMGAGNAMFEMPAEKYALSDGWLARDGKTYIVCRMHEADLMAAGMGGVIKIDCDREAGLVGLKVNGSLTPDSWFGARADGDDATAYFLTAPMTGSRDSILPFTWKENGVEYIKFAGYVAVEESAVETLKPGTYDIPAGACVPFKVCADCTLDIEYKDARAVFHSNNPDVVSDSLEKPISRVSDGWLMILSESGTTLKVSSLEEKNAICGPNVEFAQKAYKMLDKARGEGTAVSFAIIKDGKLVAAAAAGTQDGDPAHPATIDDLYNIGSCSKVYCTMAVMQLVEKGLVDLDTPIVKYLPEFTMRDERYKKITLRHCLNHSNGFPGTGYYMGFMQKFDSNEVFKKHFLDYLSKSVLKAEPGEYSVYANDGFIMAQIIVEKITGLNYTEYVQKYLLQPIGCNTACSGYNNPGNRKLVNMKGRKDETIMVVGTGGISTDMRECARFAWECVEPGKIFSAESLAETAKRARTTHEVPEALTTYGLGWDNVALKGYGGLDLGDGCLSKGGGTLQFGSHFFCSKKLGIACAMSATGDCGINTTQMLCKLICELIGQEFKEEEVPKVKPLPEDFEKEYAGTYYSSTGAQEFRVEDGKVNVYVRMSLEGDPTKAAEDLKWVGDGFWMDGNIVKFITDDRGCKYMVRCMPDLGECGFGEKITKPLPKINDAWLARDGKKFFNCDANYYDLILGGLYGTAQVNCDRETNVVGFIFRGSLIPFARTPMACLDDTHTVNFLNCPGMGSRDTFAPFVWTVDGVEHLYCYGYEFIAEDGLDLLGVGTVKLGKDVCKAYKIPEGKSYKLSCEGVRVVVYDKDLNCKHDSLEAGPVESVGEGYVIFVTQGEADVKICE